MVSQDTFQTCYRGNQSVIRHAAYMRMSKVFLIQHLLNQLNVRIEDKSIFDYGFGAGTFFRHCPTSSRLFGVELDPITVREVTQMLNARGYRAVDLQPIQLENWKDHPLLNRKYDLIVCSHVLEHLAEPAQFLQRVGQCLEDDGLLLGLVPINERRMETHHVQQLTRSSFEAMLPQTDLRLVQWMETDAWLYWVQPVFCYQRGLAHTLSQALSLSLGLMALASGPRCWFRCSDIFARISRSKPTQAAFVLRR
jgi:2-polyprenyl-3-methyl-5-hydroxy-6-metoxy-1,4-benzoquinol methylase